MFSKLPYEGEQTSGAVNGLKDDELREASVEAVTEEVLDTQTDQTEAPNDVNGTDSPTNVLDEPMPDKEDQNSLVSTDSHLSPQDMRRARKIRVRQPLH